MPGPLPAADDVEPGVELGQEPGDLGGIVLPVAVEGEDRLPPARPEPRRQGGGLAEVPAEPDSPDPRVAPGQLGDDPPGVVAAPVVDEDDLPFPLAEPNGVERGDQLVIERN